MKLRWVIKYGKQWLTADRHRTWYFCTQSHEHATKFATKAEAAAVAARECRLTRGYNQSLIRITARPFRRRRAVTPQPAE